jgi:YVTN family beta-propeller protein
MQTLLPVRGLCTLLLLMLVSASTAWAEPFAYIANRIGNTVSVVDTASNTVTATVPVGANPWGIAVNQAGTRVYTANQTANTVSVINTGTNTVTATVPMGNQPLGIAVNPAGTRVYVGNFSDDTVKVIDTSSNTVVATVAVGNGPIGIVVSPDGSRVYVANSPGNSVSVIDAGSNTVVATVPVGSSPVGIAINPAGTKVYTGNSGTNNVSVIDTGSNTVTATIAGGTAPRGITITPDGNRAYLANQTSQDVTVIDLGSNTVTATVPLGAAPYGVSVNPAGTAVYVAMQTAGSVKVIETAGNTVSTTITLAGGKVSLGNFFAAAVVTTPTDPIPPLDLLAGTPGITTQLTVLNLAAGQGPTMTDCLQATARALFGADATYMGQNTSGVAKISINGGRVISFYPLQASTSTSQAIGITLGNSNTLTVGTSCGSFTIAPALYNVADFGAAISGMGLTAQISRQGVISVVSGDTVYVARPDYMTSVVTTGMARTPSLALGADGLYRLVDSSGTVQILRPAFVDTDALTSQFPLALGMPGVTLLQTDGSATFSALNGQQYTLTPDLTLRRATADQAALLWWADGPNRYVLRGNTLVMGQGLGARLR